jgi:carboxymethylenebutenolidase
MSGRDVTVRAADGGRFGAYLAEPPARPAPGIIVLQEIFGVNAYVRGVVDHLAAGGFLAIAPDLFWRQEPNVKLDGSIAADRDRAMALFKGLDERLAVEDGAAAVRFLRELAPACTGNIGVVGYCLGGKLAYLIAARCEIDAAVSYYGVSIQAALDEASRIRAPVLLHIAGADHLCPPQVQAQIIDSLAPYHDRIQIHVHPGAGHGFARTGGATYDPVAAGHADTLTAAFLERHLR